MNILKPLAISALTMTTALSAATADAASPLDSYKDDANLMIAGTVSDLTDDEFLLNADGKMVRVEFEDWDLDADANLKNYLKNGDQVVVSGTVDKDLFEETELEADNIYFRSNYNYYYVVDTNPAYSYDYNNYMEDGSYVSTRGKITKISGEEVTINANGMDMVVDTASLENQSIGEDGLNLKVGDRIYAYGQIDKNLFDSRELSADAIIKINQKMNDQMAMSQ